MPTTEEFTALQKALAEALAHRQEVAQQACIADW
jgi:hypothetical protein